MADLQELLAVSRLHNAAISTSQIEKTVAAITAASKIVAPALPGAPISELNLVNENEDPFGGNINNRKVAKRISEQSRRMYTNHSLPIHTGDPVKAAEDIARSERLNPEVIAEPEEDVEKPAKQRKPTPGSPAALKAAVPVAPVAAVPSVAPPAWKPNA